MAGEKRLIAAKAPKPPGRPAGLDRGDFVYKEERRAMGEHRSRRG
jgi:hypothetical protein